MEFDAEKEATLLVNLANEVYWEGRGQHQAEGKILEELDSFRKSDIHFAQVNDKLPKAPGLLAINLIHGASSGHQLAEIHVAGWRRGVINETLDLTEGVGAARYGQADLEVFNLETCEKR